MLCRGTYRRDAESAGSCILGIVFVDESVFQKLDLNCVTTHDYADAKNLERFGRIEQIFRSGSQPIEGTRIVTNEPISAEAGFELTAEERQLNQALFTMSEALKRYLRGVGPLDEVRKKAADLRTAMQRHPVKPRRAVGNMMELAGRYLRIADKVEPCGPDRTNGGT